MKIIFYKDKVFSFDDDELYNKFIDEIKKVDIINRNMEILESVHNYKFDEEIKSIWAIQGNGGIITSIYEYSDLKSRSLFDSDYVLKEGIEDGRFEFIVFADSIENAIKRYKELNGKSNI